MKKIIIVLAVILTFSLTSCKKDEFRESYNLDKNYNIKVISPKEFKELVDNKETFVVMFGFPTCPWCQQLIKVYDDISKNYNIPAYYCDIKDMRDNPESLDKVYYEFLYNYAHDALDTEKDRINAPTLLQIKDGNLLQYHLDTVDGHIINDAGVLPELTNEQKNELNKILESFFCFDIKID